MNDFFENNFDDGYDAPKWLKWTVSVCAVMKKSFLFVALLSLCMFARAQSLTVIKPLEMLPNSQAVVSYNNEFGSFENLELDVPFPYAVIRVELEGDGEDVREAKLRLGLDLGRMYAVQSVNTNENNCILFLVPRGVKSVYMRCGDGCEKQLLLSGAALVADKVYVCKVCYKKENSKPKDEVPSWQFLVLTCEPKSAIIEVDGVMVESKDGQFMEMLPKGRHEFRVSAKNYHTDTGSVVIGAEKKSVHVELKPAYGWIEIAGPMGASVFIDGEKIGNAPIKSDAIASGYHDVRLLLDKFLPFREQVLVKDNETSVLKPQLTVNYASVVLKSSQNAGIWVNGEKQGVESVRLDLTPGEYTFETKQTAHRSQRIVRNITLTSGGTIELPAPEPITGSLMVKVKPIGAEIFMDGEKVGETPLLLENVLIGKHEISVRMNGFAEHKEVVAVTENQSSSVEGDLPAAQKVRLVTGVSKTHWTIDDKDYGTASEISIVLPYTQHNVSLSADGYYDKNETFTVTPENNYFHFDLSKDMQQVALRKQEFKAGIAHTINLNIRFTDTHGGFGGDYIFGYKVCSWFRPGVGIGLNWLVGNSAEDNQYQEEDDNFFFTFFINSSFYIPTNSRFYPLIDAAIGGDLGVLAMKTTYQTSTVGLYGKLGAGVWFGKLTSVSAGYEYLGVHNGYIRVGFNF